MIGTLFIGALVCPVATFATLVTGVIGLVMGLSQACACIHALY